MKFLLWILSCAAFIVTAAAQSPAEDAFYAGNTAYANGDYEQAVASYEQALENGGDAAGLHANLASAYYELGDTGRALLNIQQALALAPADPLYRSKYAFIANEAGFPVEEAPIWAPYARTLPLNGWVIVGTVAAWVVLLGAVLPVLRWLPTYFGGGLVLLGVIAFLTALPPLVYYHLQSEKLIVLDAASLRVAPTEESPTTDSVAAGQSVERLEQHGQFVRVSLPDGATGYLESEEVAAVWE